MTALRIVPPRDGADAAWLALRAALWPHADASELRAEMGDVLARGFFVRLAFADDEPAGLAEAALRVDYVNGTESSPVAFLEGLYVVPAFRRRGVARALLREVERWARAAGCRELASDALLDNVAAHSVHRALGFDETERVVYFRRVLGS
jgi:aminoglycoside 6'-N-acetyltransferase I